MLETDVAEVAGRIELVQGMLGAGKTTYAALRAYKLAARYGLDLVTNAELSERWSLVSSWDEMERFPNSVILLDEVHLTLPSDSRLSTTALRRGAVDALTDCRKLRQVVIGTTQRWSSVAPIYRELGSQFVTCKPLVRGRLHVALDVDPADLRRHTKNQRRVPVGFYNPQRAEIDTLARVSPWWNT